MKDLIVALYAIVILVRGNTTSKEAYAALKNPNLKPFFESIPALKPALTGVVGEDFDTSELGKDLRTFTALYKREPASRVSIASLLSAFAQWLRNGSGGALKQIEKQSASPVFPGWINQGFLAEVGDQEKVKKSLRMLVKKMVGRPDIGFESPEEAREAKAKDPETYRKFLVARQEFAAIWKGFVSNFVRSSGKPLVPFLSLLKAMKQSNIDHGLPSGFTGKTDAAGNWYTDQDELIGATPPQVNMFPTVVMNPKYTPGSSLWVYRAIRADGTPGNYFYTVNAVRKLVSDKFQAVRDFTPMLPSIRNKWIQQIKQYSPDKPLTVCAVVLELLLQTCARIGGKAFGMSILQVKHYSTIPNGFVLKYLGKDGVATKHVYKGVDPLSKLVVGIVAGLVEGKKPTEQIFTFSTPTGSVRKITPGMVNSAFHKVGAPAAVTVHKLRTYNGTRIFQAEVKKIYTKFLEVNDPSKALALLKQAAMATATALNHVRTLADGGTKISPMTALSAYIDTSAQIEFFQHYNLPLPKHLENRIVESSVKDLVRASIQAEAKPAVDTKPVKMKEVPEPVNEPKKPEEPKEPAGKAAEEDKDDATLPQFKHDLPVKDEDLEDGELPTEDEPGENKVRKMLEESAEKFEKRLMYGGDLQDMFLRQGKFDNVLVEDRFDNDQRP